MSLSMSCHLRNKTDTSFWVFFLPPSSWQYTWHLMHHQKVSEVLGLKLWKYYFLSLQQLRCPRQPGGFSSRAAVPASAPPAGWPHRFQNRPNPPTPPLSEAPRGLRNVLIQKPRAAGPCPKMCAFVLGSLSESLNLSATQMGRIAELGKVISKEHSSIQYPGVCAQTWTALKAKRARPTAKPAAKTIRFSQR